VHANPFPNPSKLCSQAQPRLLLGFSKVLQTLPRLSKPFSEKKDCLFFWQIQGRGGLSRKSIREIKKAGHYAGLFQHMPNENWMGYQRNQSIMPRFSRMSPILVTAQNGTIAMTDPRQKACKHWCFHGYFSGFKPFWRLLPAWF
jgi:hypothetical protein